MTLAAEQERLINDNIRLVYFLARKYHSHYYDPEDVVSIGCIGLIKAACAFRADRGVKFSTFASRCIENEIRSTLRKEKSEVQTLSFPVAFQENGLPHEADLIEDNTSHALIDQCEHAELINALRSLPEIQKQLIKARYIEGLTQIQAGSLLDLSQSRISRLEKAALIRLKETLQSRQ